MRGDGEEMARRWRGGARRWRGDAHLAVGKARDGRRSERHAEPSGYLLVRVRVRVRV
jgi:hypothetical protein